MELMALMELTTMLVDIPMKVRKSRTPPCGLPHSLLLHYKKVKNPAVGTKFLPQPRCEKVPGEGTVDEEYEECLQFHVSMSTVTVTRPGRSH